MSSNLSRELLALACIAFKKGEFNTAGTLFAEAMCVADSTETICTLLPQDLSASASEELDSEPSPDLDSLASISRSVSISMERTFRKHAESGLDSNVGSDTGRFT